VEQLEDGSWAYENDRCSELRDDRGFGMRSVEQLVLTARMLADYFKINEKAIEGTGML
jgi:hypothetical protein